MKLIIEHLQKNFEDKKVLEDISFCFEKGKIYGLLGRNGAGKTTLFNCLNQDLEIDKGDFYLEDNGRKPLTMSDIGYVFINSNSTGISNGTRIFKVFYWDQY